MLMASANATANATAMADAAAGGDAVLGAAGALVAALGFGSNFVVVKKFEMGDGVAFNLFMTIGILLVGTLTLLAAPRDLGDGELRPQLPLFCVLGGAVWSVGNVCTVPIVSRLGLGLGLALWSGTSIVVAFITGRLGPCIGGMCLEVVPLEHPPMAWVGCALSLVALALLSLVRVTQQQGYIATRRRSLGGQDGVEVQLPAAPDSAVDTPAKPAAIALRVPRCGPGTATKLQGVALAVFAGVMYGLQFLPCALDADDRQRRAAAAGAATAAGGVLARVRVTFAQYLGSFWAAVFFYAAYFGLLRVRSREQRRAAHALPTGEAVVPAILSGMIWACAGLGAMLAMDGLGFGVGYMLCTNGAILVNGAWSVGYYREISGRRDLALFGGAFALNLAASAIIAEHRSLCLVTSALANGGHAPDEALGDVIAGGDR